MESSQEDAPALAAAWTVRPVERSVARAAGAGTGAPVASFDITKSNAAVDRLLDVTENARHRYMLLAYHRHRNLEMAGRYREIFEPEMIVEGPVYRFDYLGQQLKLEGREQVEAVYRDWSETDQCVFYAEDEELAVGDSMIVSRVRLHQQTLGAVLAQMGYDVDAGAMYLASLLIVMVWPYDERCRLIGEDVWEYDVSGRRLIRLDPADVLSTERAGELLSPHIAPLPPFDDSLLPREPLVHPHA